MKKIILTILLSLILIPAANVQNAQAALVSNRSYRAEVRKEQKQNIKLIKELFKKHNEYANKHDLENLNKLYADNYINNDGFAKDAYFKSIEATWEACKDITYTTDITSIDINGDHASVYVDETASGTLLEVFDELQVAGEIHSKSKGIYELININGNWYISSETALADESSLLYGDARFMNIELQAPAQVSAGETYTATLKTDADDNTFVMASINSDPIIYPAKTPENNLKVMPQSKILERVIKANSNNLNEYVVASMAISKVHQGDFDDYKIYMAGLACLMKRINVVPKNNFIKLED